MRRQFRFYWFSHPFITAIITGPGTHLGKFLCEGFGKLTINSCNRMWTWKIIALRERIFVRFSCVRRIYARFSTPVDNLGNNKHFLFHFICSFSPSYSLSLFLSVTYPYTLKHTHTHAHSHPAFPRFCPFLL